MSKITKEQRRVILAIDFGNILEWYDIYSFAYLVPVLAKVFFPFESSIGGILSSFLVFGIGSISRLLGSLYFGNLGDHVKGRRTTFLISIMVTTFATILTGCLPSYQTLGIISPILLIILRLLQSFGAAGEFPGAICFLYENADPSNRRFMASWAGVGNQIGAIIGITETFLMDKFMSPEFFLTWGWRFSFWYGGIIGIVGIFLRKSLHETPPFEKLKEKNKIDNETQIQIIKNNPRKIILGVAFGAVNAATFYLLATYIPTFFENNLKLGASSQFFVNLIMLVVSTGLIPFFGRLGDKCNNKKILIGSALIIIALLYPLYYYMSVKNIVMIGIIGFAYLFPITSITALLTYRLANLFHTSIRFTGVSLTWNLADAIIGGFSPAVAIFLLRATGVDAAFCWFVLFTAVISLASYTKIKD